MNLKEYLLKLKKIIKKENRYDCDDEVQLVLILKEIEQLEIATEKFFPLDGHWTSICFRKENDYSMHNLPCHLRDDKWLANMMKINQRLDNISLEQILNFIKTSDFFKQKRHDYEQKIVKWQINWMKNGGENWIVDKNYGEEFWIFTSECDLAFRKGIVDTLTAVGMDEQAIEEGIETNIDSWRDGYMKKAFENKYEPVYYSIFKSHGENLEPADSEHKEKWLKMRKYRYYQEHKASIEMYGVVEPEMLMSDEEAIELMLYLEKKDIERMKYIEENRNANNQFQKVLK